MRDTRDGESERSGYWIERAEYDLETANQHRGTIPLSYGNALTNVKSTYLR